MADRAAGMRQMVHATARALRFGRRLPARRVRSPREESRSNEWNAERRSSGGVSRRGGARGLGQPRARDPDGECVLVRGLTAA